MAAACACPSCSRRRPGARWLTGVASWAPVDSCPQITAIFRPTAIKSACHFMRFVAAVLVRLVAVLWGGGLLAGRVSLPSQPVEKVGDRSPRVPGSGTGGSIRPDPELHQPADRAPAIHPEVSQRAEPFGDACQDSLLGGPAALQRLTLGEEPYRIAATIGDEAVDG